MPGANRKRVGCVKTPRGNVSAQVHAPVEGFSVDAAARQPTVGERLNACNAAIRIQIAELCGLKKINSAVVVRSASGQLIHDPQTKSPIE